MRIKRLCTHSEDCTKRLENIRKWYSIQGCPKQFVGIELDKVKVRSSDELL